MHAHVSMYMGWKALCRLNIPYDILRHMLLEAHHGHLKKNHWQDAELKRL